MTFLVNSPLLHPVGSTNVHIIETIEIPSGLTGNQVYQFTNRSQNGDCVVLTALGFLGGSNFLTAGTTLGTLGYADSSTGKVSWQVMNFNPVPASDTITVAQFINSKGIATLLRGSQDPHLMDQVPNDGSTSPTTLGSTGFTKNAAAKFIMYNMISLSNYQTSGFSPGTTGFLSADGTMARDDFDSASLYTNGTSVVANAATHYGSDMAIWGVEFR